MLKKGLVAIFALILSLLTLSGCGSQPTAPTNTPAKPTAVSITPAAALTKTTVMLDWVPNTNHTGLYVAAEKGYYKEQGLDVEIVQPSENGVEQLVAVGKVDFGVSYQEQLTNARTQNVPIVSVAAVIQHNSSGFASPKAKGITRPKDFEGKRYGGWGSPTEKQVLAALMKCDGGDVNKVEFVDIGSNDFFVATQRDIDFSWIFQGWTGIEAQTRGIDLDYVALKDWTTCVPDYYTPILITSEQTIKNNPELVRKFLAATSKGYQFAIDNPAEAAEILIKNNPEGNPELIRKSQAYVSPLYAEGAKRWGEQSLDIWQGYGNWMADQGLLTKRIDAEQAFTNDFLPK